jgi:hypothetical protein
MENNIEASSFLVIWHQAMLVGAGIMLATGILLFFVYHILLSSLKDYKAKYDFINQKEIKDLKVIFLCFAIAVFMLINRYGMDDLKEVEVWFFVRLFMSIAGGTLVSYVSFLILDYYYPTVIDKKLKKWRYMPRTSSTGSKMRLLSEEEEDVHLEEGMQAEENIFSMDYDVWVDEKSGDIKIEKYQGHLQALKCNSCGFYTMKVSREEITQQPSAEGAGELVKHYQCGYCKSVRATAFKISTKQGEDYKRAPNFNFKKNTNIDLVQIEIHSSLSGKKFFEFQSIEQAKKFLDEFEDKG